MSFSIANTRAYFDARILECDSNLSFLDDPYGDDSISSAYPDKFYKLWFGDLDSEVIDNSYVDKIPLTIEIYEPRARDVTTSFDTLLDKAIDIKNNIMSPTKVKNQTVFTDIEPRGVEIIQIDTDDKTMVMRLNFIIRYDFCY